MISITWNNAYTELNGDFPGISSFKHPFIHFIFFPHEKLIWLDWFSSRWLNIHDFPSLMYSKWLFFETSDAVTTILSAFYAKLLVVLGMAFPITEILSKEVTTSFYQGFYLYLYLGSISFLIVIYTTVAKEKAVNSLLSSYRKYPLVQ